ncbi:sperm motility kinase w-like [Stylonychia lemnae]|uniref:non-specific serine/threonine protein kinase n=1 Tax=Stylonychia lemnae TaxID=5949 RepID=A0A077ZZA8_STYLE|nr:sperm motility kinase w-like [Stylonychia lemnae]|eukprot:CDW74922.1 sperm motility kinase w-like [Stylonychia lemnae]
MIMIQIVSALDYIHEQNFIHRDISPDNILVFNNEKFKICDFGVASYGSITFEQVGKRDYMAPEILLAEDGYDKTCDIWSLGILLYYLCTAQSKYQSNSLLFSIRKKKSIVLPSIYSQFQGLLNKILQIKPHKRPGLNDIKQDLASMIQNKENYVEYQKEVLLYELNIQLNKLKKSQSKIFDILEKHSALDIQNLHPEIKTNCQQLDKILQEYYIQLTQIKQMDFNNSQNESKASVNLMKYRLKDFSSYNKLEKILGQIQNQEDQGYNDEIQQNLDNEHDFSPYVIKKSKKINQTRLQRIVRFDDNIIATDGLAKLLIFDQNLNELQTLKYQCSMFLQQNGQLYLIGKQKIEILNLSDFNVMTDKSLNTESKISQVAQFQDNLLMICQYDGFVQLANSESFQVLQTFFISQWQDLFSLDICKITTISQQNLNEIRFAIGMTLGLYIIRFIQMDNMQKFELDILNVIKSDVPSGYSSLIQLY